MQVQVLHPECPGAVLGVRKTWTWTTFWPQQLISDGIIKHFGTMMIGDGYDDNEDGQDNYNDGGQES